MFAVPIGTGEEEFHKQSFGLPKMKEDGHSETSGAPTSVPDEWLSQPHHCKCLKTLRFLVEI